MRSGKQRMIFRRRSRASVALATSVVVSSLLTSPTQAKPTFVVTNDGSASAEMEAAFAVATARWAANYTNDVTINITLGGAPLSGSALNFTTVPQTPYVYNSVRSALIANKTSTDDASTTASLSANSMWILINRTIDNPNGAGSATPYLDNDGDANNTTVRMGSANAKALGLYTGLSTTSDATINFNGFAAFDYNPADGITAGQYDFVGVAMHEIGHVLGCRSGVDVLDASPNMYTDSQLPYVSTQDLFRVSAASYAYGTGVIDFTASASAKNFDVNGGFTSVSPLGTGKNFGDGKLAGDLKTGTNAVMEATIPIGTRMAFTETDRRLFDVIGWTRDTAFEWKASAGGSFNEPMNWDADGVPATGLIGATFDLGETYTGLVTFTGSSGMLDLINRRDTLTVAPSLSQTLSVSRDFIVGTSGSESASLTLSGGGTFSTVKTQIGTAAGGTGTVTFNSGNWTNTGSVYVGVNGGAGTLNRSSPGTFTVNGFLEIGPGGFVEFTNGSSTVNTLNILSSGRFYLTSGTLNAPQVFINSGGLFYRSGGTASLGNVDGSGSFVLANSGNVVATHVRAGFTNIVSGARLTISKSGLSTATSKFTSLGMGLPDAASTIDLNDNFLIVDYDSPQGNPRATITNYVKTGRGTTTSRGVYQYNGLGIISSVAISANTQAGFNKFSLGVINNADLVTFNGASAAYTVFGGLNVDTTSVLIRYTYSGDANLDGKIDAKDYALINRGFAGSIPNVGWLSGDFTLDGVINAEDYAVIDFGYLKQGAALGSGEPISVPEPGVIGVVGVGMLALRRRRGK